jgi:hypothetical protein
MNFNAMPMNRCMTVVPSLVADMTVLLFFLPLVAPSFLLRRMIVCLIMLDPCSVQRESCLTGLPHWMKRVLSLPLVEVLMEDACLLEILMGGVSLLEILCSSSRSLNGEAPLLEILTAGERCS